MESSGLAEAAALVERLTQDEINSVASEVASGRREHILNSLDERGRAQELVQQQYSGRYPFELLQNANDAAGSQGSSGKRVRFVVTNSSLLVADEGAGFGPEQVKAICGLGRSSKDPRKSIGYKGLGFKSVGEISDSPQVLCGPLRFGFDEQRARRLLTDAAGALLPDQRIPLFGLPFPLSNDDLGADQEEIDALTQSGFRTVLRLPYRSGVTADIVGRHVSATISPKLLLFLDATAELDTAGTPHDFRAVVVRDQRANHEEVLLEIIGSSDLRYLVYRHHAPLAQRSLVAELGKAWEEVEQVRLASPCRSTTTAGHAEVRPNRFTCTSRPTSRPVYRYCCMPTSRSIWTASASRARRRLVRTTTGWPTRWSTSSAARWSRRWPPPPATTQAAACAQSRRPTTPPASPLKFAHGCSMPVSFLPCADGATKAPSQARLLPSSTPGAARIHALAPQPTRGCVAPALEEVAATRRFLTQDLGVPELTVQTVLAGLEPDRASQDLELYELLLDWSDAAGARNFAPLLREVSCVRVIDGSWRTPPEVFFERQRGHVDFPDQLHVPIADLPDLSSLRALLEQAGVRPFEWRYLVARVLIPMLTDPDESQEQRRAAFSALASYFHTERSGDAQLDKLLSGVMVEARTARHTRAELRPASEVYFSAEWLGHDRLERLYGSFDDYEFLAEIPPPQGGNHDRSFYERLGVSPCVRVSPRDG